MEKPLSCFNLFFYLFFRQSLFSRKMLATKVTGLIVLIVAGLMLGTVVYRTKAEPQTERLDAPEQLNNHRKKIRSKSKRESQKMSQKGDNKEGDGFDSHYQVIVTNNLFRPLGWTKKKSGPSYVLLGTIIVEDSDDSQAIILDRNTKQTYSVAVGDKIGNVTVEEISEKQIVLRQQNGGSLGLKLGPLAFLNAPRETPIEDGGSEGAPLLASSQRPLGQFTPREAAIFRTATQAKKTGEPLSRTHRFGSTTLGSSSPISRERAAAILELIRLRRERERSSP